MSEDLFSRIRISEIYSEARALADFSCSTDTVKGWIASHEKLRREFETYRLQMREMSDTHQGLKDSNVLAKHIVTNAERLEKKWQEHNRKQKAEIDTLRDRIRHLENPDEIGGNREMNS